MILHLGLVFVLRSFDPYNVLAVSLVFVALFVFIFVVFIEQLWFNMVLLNVFMTNFGFILCLLVFSGRMLTFALSRGHAQGKC